MHLCHHAIMLMESDCEHVLTRQKSEYEYSVLKIWVTVFVYTKHHSSSVF